MGFFHIVSFSFQKLGLTPGGAFFLLLVILFSSSINIPITKYKVRYVKKPSFLGFFDVAQKEIEGIAINLGGAIIPLIISGYLLFKTKEIFPILVSLLFVALICKTLARFIPGRGIVLPALIPPVFAALFALLFASQNPAACAYIAGTLGTLIGADILNLHKARKYPGLISIGGAGVFDGIFLTGIVSVFLTAL
jgi:uncharacterized membrane protein